MKKRCLNSTADNYARYGGRGITIHPEWIASFETFLADVGPRPSPAHSLDRVNNDGNYVPSNVRWGNVAQQQRNKRGVRRVVFNGEITTLPDLADRFNIRLTKLRQRLDRGWSLERALS